MQKNPLRVFVWTIVGVVIMFLALKIYWNDLLSAPDPSDTNMKAFIVYKGEKTLDITQRLENERFIKSAMAFSYMIKTSGEEGKIQAGDFKLSRSMNAVQVLKELTVGVVDKWVTLLEGWRVEEIAQKLNEELGVSSNEFTRFAKAKEGYLFPDTYLLNPDASAADIVSILTNTFQQKYNDDLQNKIKNLGLTPSQGVILASIVEREARSDEVRKNVASILLKRYKIGMALNADATIQYALGYQQNEKSWWKRNLTREDFKIGSPYNTYLYAGFPPTPICNPSLSSLQAVANADPATVYLYYYHDSQGNSYYAKTLEEHNLNVANYP